MDYISSLRLFELPLHENSWELKVKQMNPVTHGAENLLNPLLSAGILVKIL